MEKRHRWPEEISDEEIKKEFDGSTEVNFSARPFNHILHRQISFGTLGWWLPLTRVLPIIGITPQMLRPIFNPQKKTVKRCFPFNLSWFGLNKNCYKEIEEELPSVVERYEQLGAFPLSKTSFQELSQIFGKSIKVLREEGGTGDHFFLFVVHPFEDTIEPTEA